MGVDLGELLPKRKVLLDDLAGRKLAVDAYNTLYQFLAIIRQPNGTLLMDGSGRVTSHLSGILYRTANLGEKGIRVAYVFDGRPPELKEMEIKRRRAVKEEAVAKYEAALTAGKPEEARKYAQATSTLRETMLDDAKRLLKELGVPCVQAPSEGEAQAAYMAARGDVWAAASQDHDSLLFGAPRVVRNLNITGKRKLPMQRGYVEIAPEIVELNETLRHLSITREQLVDAGILIGTDYNPDGVKGVGPKTALKLIKEYKNLETIAIKKPNLGLPKNADKVRENFLTPNTTQNFTLAWEQPHIEEAVSFLCGERSFSEDRVRKALERMTAGLTRASSSTTLESYF